MSIAAVDWAFKQTVGGSALKFLLVALANYADETGICYPSVRRLTEDTEQDRKTILKHIAKLEAIKLLEDTNKRCGLTRSIPIYRLLLSSPKIGTTSKQSQKRDSQAVPNFHGSSPVFPPKQSQKRDTDPSGTLNEPPKGGAGATRPPKNKDASEVFLLNQAMEIATPVAKTQLIKKKKEVLGKHFEVDLNAKPTTSKILETPTTTLIVPPEVLAKHIGNLKAVVDSAQTQLPNPKVLREIRFKRPPKSLP